MINTKKNSSEKKVSDKNKKLIVDNSIPKKNIIKKKKTFKMWSALTILMLISLVFVLLSWILYWSKITTQTEVNGNVETVRIKAIGIVDLLYAPISGFISKADIMIFLFMLGAFIYIVIATKSMEGMSQSIVTKLKGKEIWAIIPLMIFFSIAGTTEGMAEESLGFYMIMIPLMLAAGFDVFTGLIIVLIGAGAGVLASTVNPFVIAVATNGLGKDVNGATISAGQGLVWRIVSWLVITTIAIIFVMLYAKKVKNNPQKSISFATLEGDRDYFLKNSIEKIEMNWRRKTSLIIFGLIFAIMIIYMVAWDKIFNNTVMEDLQSSISKYFPYLTSTIQGFGNGGLDVVASFFLIGSITVAAINIIGTKKEGRDSGETIFIKDLIAGASDLLGVALVIACAAGVGYILRESFIQELFVRGLANSVGSINSTIGKIIILYIIFLPLSFLIPSTSGFAAAVFPLLAKVCQTTSGEWNQSMASGSILSFSFASGLINLITPTSGVVMGAMAISRTDYGKFLKAILPFLGIMFAVSISLLAIGGAIGSPIA